MEIFELEGFEEFKRSDAGRYAKRGFRKCDFPYVKISKSKRKGGLFSKQIYIGRAGAEMMGRDKGRCKLFMSLGDEDRGKPAIAIWAFDKDIVTPVGEELWTITHAKSRFGGQAIISCTIFLNEFEKKVGKEIDDSAFLPFLPSKVDKDKDVYIFEPKFVGEQ